MNWIRIEFVLWLVIINSGTWKVSYFVVRFRLVFLGLFYLAPKKLLVRTAQGLRVTLPWIASEKNGHRIKNMWNMWAGRRRIAAPQSPPRAAWPGVSFEFMGFAQSRCDGASPHVSHVFFNHFKRHEQVSQLLQQFNQTFVSLEVFFCLVIHPSIPI